MAKKSMSEAEARYELPSKLKSNADSSKESRDAILDWTQLAQDCLWGNYVLVVGPDIMLNENSQQEFIRQARGNSDVYIRNVMSFFRESSDHLEFYKPNQSIHEDLCDTIYLMEDQWLFVDDMEPSLRDLIQTKCFPIVITTTYDPYMELLMRSAWGKDLQVLNIYDGGNNCRDIQLLCNDEFRTLHPTLYYAFGKAEYRSRQNNLVRKHFTVTDNDKLSIVDQWLRNPPQNMNQLLSRKRTLAIGCKQDDWLFRMLWYIWRGNVKDLKKGEVILDFSDREFQYENHLQNYLKSEGISFFDNARKFMRHLVSKIDDTRDFLKHSVMNAEVVNVDTWLQNGIFLSYASEDFLIVHKIYKQLKEKGYNVWMDVKLNDGKSDNYSKRIIKALKECKVFVPVISRQTYSILLSNKGENRYFYENEWLLVQERVKAEENLGDRSIKILPILVDKIDINFPKISIPQYIKMAQCFDLTMQKMEALQIILDAYINE